MYKLQQISTQMKSTSPVFIVGVPRSGTTVFYRTLLCHPMFKLRDHPASWATAETHLFLRPASVYVPSREIKNYLMLNDEIYHEMRLILAPLLRWQTFLAYIPQFSRLKKNSRIWWLINLYHVQMRTFFYFAQQARSVRRLLEKTPGHITKLPQIRMTFPKAKFIGLYRHPVDAFSSLRKRLFYEQKNTDNLNLAWLNVAPDEFCNTYREWIQIILQEQRANPDTFLPIKYELLTVQFDETLQKTLSFLGETSNINKPETQEKKWWLDEVVSKETEWQKYISKQDARLIESDLKEEMLTTHYSPYTDF